MVLRRRRPQLAIQALRRATKVPGRGVDGGHTGDEDRSSGLAVLLDGSDHAEPAGSVDCEVATGTGWTGTRAVPRQGPWQTDTRGSTEVHPCEAVRNAVSDRMSQVGTRRFCAKLPVPDSACRLDQRLERERLGRAATEPAQQHVTLLAHLAERREVVGAGAEVIGDPPDERDGLHEEIWRRDKACVQARLRLLPPSRGQRRANPRLRSHLYYARQQIHYLTICGPFPVGHWSTARPGGTPRARATAVGRRTVR